LTAVAPVGKGPEDRVFERKEKNMKSTLNVFVSAALGALLLTGMHGSGNGTANDAGKERRGNIKRVGMVVGIRPDKIEEYNQRVKTLFAFFPGPKPIRRKSAPRARGDCADAIWTQGMFSGGRPRNRPRNPRGSFRSPGSSDNLMGDGEEV
jgi:hypothetical protein